MDAKEIWKLLENMTDQELLRLSPLGMTRNHSPHPRQADFLSLNCEEALFGGAAGGGKTLSLLLWLAQGVEVPGYSGIFFRRTYAQLVKSNDSPLTKSHELYKPLGGKFKASEYRWTFPSGATIEFGHLQHEMSVMDYQGPAYHRVAFDELTQFSEAQYTYLFSRMRMRKDFPVRMGVRAASNPGGPGHAWVKTRFITSEAERSIQALRPFEPSPPGLVFWPAENRAFVPARVADNPSLDVDDYIKRMQSNLPLVLRQCLLNGDWSIVEDAIIRLDWLRYFTTQGDMLKAHDADGKEKWQVDERQCQRFATIDTAGTSAQKAAEKRGKPASWSVCQIWDYWPQTKFLFLRYVWRDRVAWEGLKSGVRHTLNQWKPSRVLIENAHHGPPLKDELKAFTTELISTYPGRNSESGRPGKVERATDLLNKLEKGQVFLPKFNNSWLSELEAEWLSWTGLDDETSDQIDAAAYAARHADKGGCGASWGVISAGGLRGGFSTIGGVYRSQNWH
jgi:phage terminase large subunit-like protein